MFVTQGKALLVRIPYSSRLITGVKTWELRSRPTHIRGIVGVVESGTSCIWGFIDILGCREVTPSILRECEDKHTVSRLDLEAFPYTQWFAWQVGSSWKLKEPIPIVRRKGQVIWITTDREYKLGVDDFESYNLVV